MPKISVIVPVYNEEEHLHECLESIRNQTLTDIEVILVDDGSTDRSVEILTEYTLMDHRFRLICQKNLFAGVARNNGMKQACGDYLCFLDSDDFFEPAMLELAYNRAISTASDIVVWRCNFFNSKTRTFMEYKESIKRENLPLEDPFSISEIKKDRIGTFVGWPWDKLFSARLIRENKIEFQDVRTTNDLLFVYSAMAKAERITILDEVLVHQRRGISNSLSLSREKSWDNFYLALMAFRRRLQEWNLYEFMERDFINYALNFTLWNLNTLGGEAQKNLYQRLKEEWIDELGMVKHDRDYFYKQDEYIKLQLLLDNDYNEYISAANENKRFPFPYDRIKKDDNIVLYGAGEMGIKYYNDIMKDSLCKLVLWVDKSYEIRTKEINIEIVSPRNILDIQYDVILIAVSNREVVAEIEKELLGMGVKRERILAVNN